MLPDPVDLDEIRPRVDGVGQRGLFVEGGAELVEVGHGQLGAELHGAGIGLDLAEDEFEQRGLAAAVRADQADLVAAQQAAREVLDDVTAAVGLGDAFELGHQLAGTLGLADLQFHLADTLAARRALEAQLLEPQHTAFVAGAPSLDALPDPHLLLREELVELAVVDRLGGEVFGLADLVGAEVARIRGEIAAVELDDLVGHRVEEAAVVGDEEHAAGIRLHHAFQPFDRGHVEVVGGLVEQQQAGLQHQRARQGHALLQAAGKFIHLAVRVERQARQRAVDLVLQAPAVGRVEPLLQFVHARGKRLVLVVLGEGMRRRVVLDQQLVALAQALGHGFEHREARLEKRFLRDGGELEVGRAPDLAVIALGRAFDHAQQAGLARAVAADEADAPARLDDQVHMIEQRDMPEREGDFGELDQRHEWLVPCGG